MQGAQDHDFEGPKKNMDANHPEMQGFLQRGKKAIEEDTSSSKASSNKRKGCVSKSCESPMKKTKLHRFSNEVSHEEGISIRIKQPAFNGK